MSLGERRQAECNLLWLRLNSSAIEKLVTSHREHKYVYVLHPHSYLIFPQASQETLLWIKRAASVRREWELEMVGNTLHLLCCYLFPINLRVLHTKQKQWRMKWKLHVNFDYNLESIPLECRIIFISDLLQTTPLSVSPHTQTLAHLILGKQ